VSINNVVEDTTPQLGGDLASNGNDILFAYNDKAIFGAGNDLQIFHNGTTSYIRDVGDGDLQIFATDDVYIRGYSTNNYMARFNENGAVTLYYDNAAKLATTSTGIDVTGTVNAAKADIDISTNARLTINSDIGEVGNGNVALQAQNSAGSALKPLGFRAEDIRFATGSSERMRITDTGIDVTGTATMDGLTVDGNARIEELGAIAKLTLERGGSQNNADSAAVDLIETNAGSEGANFGDAATNGFRLKLDGSANDFLIQSGASGTVRTRLGIDRDTGDISFYEDTGTTAKFFWDASAESLGIGTASPTRELEVTGTGNVYMKVTAPTANDSAGLELANTGATWLIQNDDTSSEALTFDRAGAEAMRIDSSGKVGIGVTPSSEFHVKGDANTIARIEPNNNSGKATLLVSSTGSGDGGIQYDANNNQTHLFSYSDMTFNVGTGN